MSRGTLLLTPCLRRYSVNPRSSCSLLLQSPLGAGARSQRYALCQHPGRLRLGWIEQRYGRLAEGAFLAFTDQRRRLSGRCDCSGRRYSLIAVAGQPDGPAGGAIAPIPTRLNSAPCVFGLIWRVRRHADALLLTTGWQLFACRTAEPYADPCSAKHLGQIDGLVALPSAEGRADSGRGIFSAQ